MKPKFTISARAQLAESAAEWLIPPPPIEPAVGGDLEQSPAGSESCFTEPTAEIRRDPRKSTSPSWTGHIDLERGFVLPQSSPVSCRLNTRRCKKHKYVPCNMTEYFCLPHLTKPIQKNNNTNKHTLVEEPWWESQGAITSSQKFLELSKIPRGWKYLRAPQWALWVSEKSPKYFVQVISSKLGSKTKQPNENKTKNPLKVLRIEWKIPRNCTMYVIPCAGLAPGMYLLEHTKIYSYP